MNKKVKFYNFDLSDGDEVDKLFSSIELDIVYDCVLKLESFIKFQLQK